MEPGDNGGFGFQGMMGTLGCQERRSCQKMVCWKIEVLGYGRDIRVSGEDRDIGVPRDSRDAR